MIWREIREKQELELSPFASKSVNSYGRLSQERKCPVRTDYERDADRILYSMEFRRLRHKTQVFFNAKNDHICTRMEHVLYVGSISKTIARTLNLNQDLTYAISLGHDLGHAPFGHSGERVLDRCIKNNNFELSFHHEAHGLRVVDRLATRISEEKINEKCGLNLTFEVRDGIISHCGENYSEYYLERDALKKPSSLIKIPSNKQNPYTLEGCLVRLVDKIAYVGRDIEDAVRVKLMDINDIPKEICNELGYSNAEIINTLVCDIIENSYKKDFIKLSVAKGEALKELISENVRLIYQTDKIKRYEKTAENVIEGLYFDLLENCDDIERLKTSSQKVYRHFHNFMKEVGYDNEDSKEQKVVDFIAGMTDNYAMSCYEELFWM